MRKCRLHYMFSLKYIKLYLLVEDLAEVNQLCELMSLAREICYNKKEKMKNLFSRGNTH